MRRSLLLTLVALLAPAATAEASLMGLDVEPSGVAHHAWAIPGGETGLGVRAAGADGAWSGGGSLLPATTTSESDPYRGSLHIEADANGNETMAWTEPDGRWLETAFVQRRSAAGVLGPKHPIATGVPRWDYLDLELNSAGDAIVVYTAQIAGGATPVYGRILRADGTLEPALRLTGTYYKMREPKLAVDPGTGDVVVAWTRVTGDPDTVQSVRWHAATGNTLRNVKTVASAAKVGVHVGMAPDGRATFLWTQVHPDCSEGGGKATARTLTRGNTLGPPVTLSAPGECTGEGSNGVVVEPDGDALLLFAGDVDGSGEGSTELRRLTAAGTLGPLVELDVGWGQNPRGATDGAGNTVLMWHRFAGYWSGQLRTRRHRANGTFGSVATVALNAGTPSARVGVSSAGVATFAWHGSNGPATRRRTPAGALSPVKPLTLE